MRLRGDDFVSYTIICRVCAAGTHAFADAKFPRACRLRRHIPYARNPQRAGTHAKCERILRGAWGRVGEEVSDMIDEPKFQFFNCLSPSPLSQRDWNSSRSDKHCLRSKKEGLIRRMANSA